MTQRIDAHLDHAIGVVEERILETRSVKAFPSTSLYSDQEKRAIIEGLPPVDTPGVLPDRLQAAARFGFMRLDLARAALGGSWRASKHVDAEVREFANNLSDDLALQRELGVVSFGGVIERGTPAARHHVWVQELTPQLTELDYFQIGRGRTLADYAIRATGDSMSLVKDSGFVMKPDAPQILKLAAKVSLGGGIPADFAYRHDYTYEQILAMQTRLQEIFARGIEDGIDYGASWLWPVAMNYFVEQRHKTKKRS